MKFKFNRQNGIKDCGVSCLYNIIRFYNGNISFEKLRKMAKTNKNGTSVYEIVRCANKLGLISYAYECTFDNLKNITCPCIAHIKVNNVYSHFVIIKKIKNNEVFIFDPVRGNIKYNINKFLSEWTNIVITFKPTNNIINEKEDKFFMLKKLNINKRECVKLSVLSLFYSLIMSFNIFFLGYIIDNINNNNLILIFLLFSFFEIIINYIRSVKVIKFNKNIDYNLISSTLNHIMHLPITYHHNRPVGDIVSRIYDLYYIKDFINELLFSSIIDILYIMFVMFFLFCLNRLLFVLIMIVSILYFIIYYFYRDKINAYILNTKESQSEANSGIIENLLGIDSIKNLGLENKFFKLQANKYYNYLNNNEKCLKEYLNYNSISKLIEIFGLCLMLFVSNVLIKNKIISFGNLFIFYSFYNYLFIIYKRIIDTDNLIINSKHAYNRISDLLNIDRENNTNNSKKFENEIKLSNFQININNNLIPNNKFNLKIKKGNSFFITGESGIGKSTIFKSIVKQYHSNNIFLDKQSINSFPITYLREKICYVSQNEYIFTDTINNNICMHRDIKEEEKEKAFKTCLINEIFKNKNINQDFILEENGSNISSGERQKILLARTLLSKSDFIILDETMNEIDVNSERKILKNIMTEYNKTIILISHRLDNKDLFDKFIKIN